LKLYCINNIFSYIQATVSVAHNTVFSISFLGGNGVKPVKINSLTNAEPQVLKIEPTLYKLLILF